MVTDRQKSTLCEVVNTITGVAAGATTGVYIADAVSTYSKVSDALRYTSDVCGGLVGGATGGIVGITVGIFLGQLLYNRPRQMNFREIKSSEVKDK